MGIIRASFHWCGNIPSSSELWNKTKIYSSVSGHSLCHITAIRSLFPATFQCLELKIKFLTLSYVRGSIENVSSEICLELLPEIFGRRRKKGFKSNTAWSLFFSATVSSLSFLSGSIFANAVDCSNLSKYSCTNLGLRIIRILAVARQHRFDSSALRRWSVTRLTSPAICFWISSSECKWDRQPLFICLQ